MFLRFSAGGPYGGQQQQWRQQNATPPSDHVVTLLSPPYIISGSILVRGEISKEYSCLSQVWALFSPVNQG